MQFIKLNKQIDIGSFTETSLINAYAINGKGISFHNIENYNIDLIFSVIPERFRKDFFVREMKINCAIPPHTDSYVKATLNFYVKTSNCRTLFFKKADNSLGERLTTQTTGRTFSEKDLEFSGSFVAKDNDVWLLNVSDPHSVKSIDNSKVDRLAVVLQSTNYDFNQVYEMLCETGYIKK